MEITKSQDTLSKYKVYSLVKDKFCLDENSLKLFKERLFYDRNIPKEYSFVKNTHDLRYIKKIEDKDILSEIDDGWSIFKNEFESLSFFENLGYHEYSTNKVKENNSEIRIQKYIAKKIAENEKDKNTFLNSYFYRHSEYLRSDSNGFHFQIVKDKIEKDGEKVHWLRLTDLEKEGKEYKIRGHFSVKSFSYSRHNFIVKINKDEFLEIFNNDFIVSALKTIFEEIGRCKLPLKNGAAYLVISLNMADFMLASTSENWGSCLNLYSEYDGGYWTGLPGLIGDKNRAIMYFTDLSQKSFMGIKSYKMMSRTWLILGRETKKHKLDCLDRLDNPYAKRTFLCSLNSYPNYFNFKKMLEVVFKDEIKIPITQGDRNEFPVSRYYIENLFHKFGGNKLFTTAIYLDYLTRKISKKNKSKYYPNMYSHYSGKSCGWYMFFFEEEYMADKPKYLNDDLFYLCDGLDSVNYNISEGINTSTWNSYFEDNFYGDDDDYDDDDYDD